jgi:hypothetical protein
MERAVNIYCLAGIILALLPIAASWVTADDSLPLGVGRHISAIDIMTDRVTADCPCFLMSATIFTVATIFLLVSPLGSLFQIVAMGVLVLGSPFRVYCGDVYCIFNGHIGIGFLVAATAAALSLLGIVFPWGLTRGRRLVRLRDRFITFAAID